MQLPHSEVVKEEREVWGGIAVRFLLVRQPDVEADRWRTGFCGPTISRFHNAGTSAGCNDVVSQPIVCNESSAPLGCHATEAPRLLVPSDQRLVRFQDLLI